jgi:hypothetical protein
VKIRPLLTAGVAVAAVTAAFVVSRSVVAPVSAASLAPAARTMSLPSTAPVSRAAFAGATGRVAIGKRVAGVIPARTARPGTPASPLRTAAAASCTEPNCDLSYHGGPVQHSPRVYLVFWGRAWTTSATAQQAETYLLSFYKGLGKTSKDGWSTTSSQYGDAKGHPVFGTSLLAGYHIDTTKLPSSVTVGNLGNEASKALSFFRITNTNDAEIVIASQPGTCFAPPAKGMATFAGNCGHLQTSGYCAFHDYDTSSSSASHYLPWVNLPFQLDAGPGCGANFVSSMLDGFSITAGHETMETVNDPVENAWYDAKDGLSGGEIADKCAWGGAPFGVTDPVGDITLTTGPFAMQSLWSNAAGRCVMNGGLPLSVTTPAAQRSVLGKGASLQIHATLGGRAPLSYAASGLPGGVSITKSTGKVSGTPNVTAGTFTVKVVVSYYGGRKTVSFGWQVSSAPGTVRGYDSKCVDDSGGSTANGNKIDIWSCTGKAPQQVTFAASGELALLGKCVTGGKTAFLEPCADTPGQVWRRLANGSYVLKLNGKCLTDPGSSKRNGTGLTLAACKNTANQHWSLP